MADVSRDPREHWLKPHFSKNEVANSGYTKNRPTPAKAKFGGGAVNFLCTKTRYVRVAAIPHVLAALVGRAIPSAPPSSRPNRPPTLQAFRSVLSRARSVSTRRPSRLPFVPPAFAKAMAGKPTPARRLSPKRGNTHIHSAFDGHEKQHLAGTVRRN